MSRKLTTIFTSTLALLMILAACYLNIYYSYWLILIWKNLTILILLILASYCFFGEKKLTGLEKPSIFYLIFGQVAWVTITILLLASITFLAEKQHFLAPIPNGFWNKWLQNNYLWAILLPYGIYILATIILNQAYFKNKNPAYFPAILYPDAKQHPKLFIHNFLSAIFESSQNFLISSLLVVSFILCLGTTIQQWLQTPTLNLILIIATYFLYKSQGQTITGWFVRKHIPLGLIIAIYYCTLYAFLYYIRFVLIDIFNWEEPLALSKSILYAAIQFNLSEQISIFYISWCLLALPFSSSFISRYSQNLSYWQLIIIMLVIPSFMIFLYYENINIDFDIINIIANHSRVLGLFLIALIVIINWKVYDKSQFLSGVLNNDNRLKSRSLIKTIRPIINIFFFNLYLMITCGWIILKMQLGLLIIFELVPIGMLIYYIYAIYRSNNICYSRCENSKQ